MLVVVLVVVMMPLPLVMILVIFGFREKSQGSSNPYFMLLPLNPMGFFAKLPEN
jgi:hypothetical protein